MAGAMTAEPCPTPAKRPAASAPKGTAMATPYLVPVPLGDDSPIAADARAAGIADAYNDHAAGTPLTVMHSRLEWLTSNLRDDTFTAYVLGYASAVISMRLHDQAVATAQTAIAFEDQEIDR